jgi:hypothetical protein
LRVGFSCKDGVPKFHELEPRQRLAHSTRAAASGCVAPGVVHCVISETVDLF